MKNILNDTYVNTMIDELDIKVVPVMIRQNHRAPAKGWKYHKKIDWTIVILPGDMTHNDYRWAEYHATTWEKLEDHSLFSKLEEKDPIEDSMEIQRKDGIHGREVNGLIETMLTRLYMELLDIAPPKVIPKAFQNCVSSKSRCINYRYQEPDAKSTTASREEGPVSPCMYCKAKGCLIDEDEVNYFNSQLMTDGGYATDGYGRTRTITRGFASQSLVNVYHHLDPQRIKEELEADEQAGDLAINWRGRSQLEALKRDGVTTFVEDAGAAYRQFGATGNLDLVQDQAAFLRTLLPEDISMEEAKELMKDKGFKAALYDKVKAYLEMEDREKDKTYDEWLTESVQKIMREHEAREKKETPWWQLEQVEEIDEGEGADEVVPNTIKLVTVADKEVTIEMLRYHLAWSEAAGCPYFSNYSFGHYKDPEDKSSYVPARWWAKPENIAVHDKEDYFIRLAAGDIEVIYDREVCVVWYGDKQLSVRKTHGEAKALLDYVQYE